MEYKNKKEYRVFGIKRSGNHAIINWIFTQSFPPVVFLNNCYPIGSKTLSIYEGIGRIDCKGINYWDYKQKILPWETNPFNNEYKITYSKKDSRFKFDKLKNCEDKIIITSFEDRNIDNINLLFDYNHDLLVGSSEKIFNLIILRDPFNLLASIHKKWMDKDLYLYANLWKEYARKYIEYRESNQTNLININYNRWVVEQNYRESLAKKLDITFTDEGKCKVTNFGGGSSFDGISSNKNAEEMGIFERWKQFMNDPAFCDLFKDEELIDLSQTIFGNVPETSQLISL